MRASLEPRMRPRRPNPVSLGMSRSVNTMTIEGSLSSACQAASPSASSRTANEALRMLAKVLRTNFESSTTRTHRCGRSLDSAMRALFRKVDHDAALHPGIDEVVEYLGKVAEGDGAAHLLQERRAHVARKALPYLVADFGRHALAGVDAKQAHAAEDEGHHPCVQLGTRGEADRGDDAIVLHRARHPREHAAAQVVHCAGPGRFVQRLYSL